MSTTDHEEIETVRGKSIPRVILVTGATGNVGRHVVSQLLRTGAAAGAPPRPFRQWVIDHAGDFR